MKTLSDATLVRIVTRQLNVTVVLSLLVTLQLITALPYDTPVTFPLAFTVATEGEEDDHE